MSDQPSEASHRPDGSPTPGETASSGGSGPQKTAGRKTATQEHANPPAAGASGAGAPDAGEPDAGASGAGEPSVPGDVAVDRPVIPPYPRAAGQSGPRGGSPGGNPWRQGQNTPPPNAFAKLRRPQPAAIRTGTLLSVLATALLSALLLGDGLGVNLLIVALPAALAAFFAAQAAGRRPRLWTLAWAVGGLALLGIPALRDAGWPTFLAVVSALALGSLALHGSHSWPGVFFGSLGLFDSVPAGLRWGWRGVLARADGSRGRWGTALRTTAVAVVLLIVFGTLFASADAAFADLLSSFAPDVSIGDSPWRVFLFLLGLVGALAASYAAAAPVRWDGIVVRPGRARNRAEWALPLIVLNLLFAAFIALQLTVLLGGYDKVLEETGLNPSEYARQGFWQLLWATVLTLLVIALALRWAPRGGPGDRTLVRSVLGVLCVLTLVVVASALRRMDLYVDAFGLTRLRISVAAVELWLGVVLLLILAAGVLGAKLLPRAIVMSAAVGVLAFGLVSPDGLIAQQNVQRYDESRTIDIDYLDGLSADAVPALDTLPEPLRSCALRSIQRNLRTSDAPWYASSWGEARARDILAERPLVEGGNTGECYRLGGDSTDSERDSYDDGGYDPY